MDPARTPVVVAAGQSIERQEVVSTGEMARRAAEAALAAAPALRERIQRVSMVAVSFSPVEARPARALAERLGLGEEVVAEVTTAGGNSPQWLVTRAAQEIQAGRLDTTLLAGAEATRSFRAGSPDASFMRGRENAEQESDPVVGTPLKGMMDPGMIAIRLFEPSHAYAMLECARAARDGRSLAEQRRSLGPLMASFSAVAAAHPYAWFREALSTEEIAEAGDANRMIAEPYPKRMNAFPYVDQGAAVIVTSLATARALGLEDRCIYPWSGADAKEPSPTTRPDPADGPAMRAAAEACLAAAGIRADELTLIDLYSCFPIAVEVGADGIGVALDDPRRLTVTGGLPFFGGPGNNYSMHAIATVAEQLPARGGLAYVGANGGLLSKHAMGVYGTTPPPNGFRAADLRETQARIDAAALPLAVEAEGEATVVASTVVYDREGGVAEAPVFATLDDGRRVAAKADPALRGELAGRSLVGERIRVAGTPLTYTFA